MIFLVVGVLLIARMGNEGVTSRGGDMSERHRRRARCGSRGKVGASASAAAERAA